MVEKLYGLLEAIGFNHPLHPMLVHIPMGMVIGAALFSLTARYWKKQRLEESAYHCAIVALIFVIPTIITGFLDWQGKFGGEWGFFIILKMILGVALTILLTVAVVLKNKGAEPKTLLIVYLLCLACAGGLGFSGGEIIYG